VNQKDTEESKIFPPDMPNLMPRERVGTIGTGVLDIGTQ
jgi:hypothetical protein